MRAIVWSLKMAALPSRRGRCWPPPCSPALSLHCPSARSPSFLPLGPASPPMNERSLPAPADAMGADQGHLPAQGAWLWDHHPCPGAVSAGQGPWPGGEGWGLRRERVVGRREERGTSGRRAAGWAGGRAAQGLPQRAAPAQRLAVFPCFLLFSVVMFRASVPFCSRSAVPLEHLPLPGALPRQSTHGILRMSLSVPPPTGGPMVLAA